MLALEPDPRASPACARAIRVRRGQRRCAARAARRAAWLGGGESSVALTAATRRRRPPRRAASAATRSPTPRWRRCPLGGHRRPCSSRTTRASARSESDGDPDRLGRGLRPPDAAAALGTLTCRGAVLSGVGAAALAASNADRAPTLVRDLRARAVYSGVGLDGNARAGRRRDRSERRRAAARRPRRAATRARRRRGEARCH